MFLRGVFGKFFLWQHQTTPHLATRLIILRTPSGDTIMSTHHIIIATERRTQPERMATSIATTLPTENPDTYLVVDTQLHSHTASGLPENLDDPQFVMVAEWDGISPYVVCHKGDYSTRNMGYAGWPDLTKEQYDAAREVLEGRT